MVPLALCKQKILQPYDASYDHPLVRILVTRQSYLHSFQIVPSEGVACHSCLGQDKVWKTDKLSSILYYMITPQLSHPINTLPPLPHYICVFRRSEWKWVKNLNERVHKIYSSGLIFAGTVNFFFSPAKRVPGACSDQRVPSSALWNPPKSVYLFWLKVAERGWESGARPLSWNSRSKPSIRQEFWHQYSSFRFRDMAVRNWNWCSTRFNYLEFGLC